MESTALRGRKVGILGGGITGLTSAFYLLRAGADVTIFEAQAQVGGLATYFDFGPFTWDKFYHCILTSDKPLLQLIDELQLTGELRWTETKVGFYADHTLYPMTTSLDMLRFPLLSLREKMRLGLGVLRAARIKDGRPLEQYLASEWLTRTFGETNYRKLWAPLLKCKLGACREEASASFIWATIARLYSTRDRNASKKERLGYVRGGYRRVFERLAAEARRMGGVILTSAPVERLTSTAKGEIELLTRGRTMCFSDVIATVPSPHLIHIAPELNLEYRDRLSRVKYLGIVCGVLVLKRRLTPNYVTNLVDEELPFTGIIEMSNLISPDETAGYHLVYVPKYTAPGDSLFDASEKEIWETFSKSLSEMFPDLKESDVVSRHLFRQRYVQPVPVLHYSDTVPSMKTNIDGLLLANTTQIINSTLNNNVMVAIAKSAVELLAARSASATPVESSTAATMSTSCQQ